jgi:hypothetical protein
MSTIEQLKFTLEEKEKKLNDLEKHTDFYRTLEDQIRMIKFQIKLKEHHG